MNATSWIALATLGFTVAATVFASISAGFRRVGGKFDAHEQVDTARHTENIGRFVRIETRLDVLLKNGGSNHR